MRHGSLFSGIGGFDLAAEWMGWENKFHCEWNEFGQKVLKYYWPNAESFTDITKTDFTKYANQIDILTGGFPCQPYSQAGKRLGKEDDRHLWPEMLRAIREVKPSWVVGENVFGLVNWNGGLVFNEVQANLEAEGYEVQPYVLPACAVNAPHRRDRIWFVAYCNNNGFHATKNRQGMGKGNDYNSARKNKTIKLKRCSNQKSKIVTNSYGTSTEYKISTRWNLSTSKVDSRTTSNSNSNGLNECNSNNEVNTSQGRINALGDISKSNDNGNATNSNSTDNKTRTQRKVLGQSDKQETNEYCNVECTNKWQNFPTVSPICNGDDGLSNRLDSITFPKWRNESIKAGGNAIVPQVVYQIFKAIEQYEHQRSSNTINR